MRNRQILPVLFSETAPLDLRFTGRVLFHAAVVGIACGVGGALFFAALEAIQRFLLVDVAGYVPLRALGERFAEAGEPPDEFRWWLLLLLPALGGLACGVLARFVPEVSGGGADVTIDAFHNRGGIIRRRVIWAKALASLVTLGTGGSGGREGPTMLIGGGIGSLAARVLRVSARERRILLVAGVAAGISAVFRTPLGAALLAVEFLYRDGFESDALVPSVLSSVIAYSVVTAFYGETVLFETARAYPFVISQLPVYSLLAVVIAALAVLFLGLHHVITAFFRRLPVPGWARPAIGGLLLGAFVVPLIVLVGARVHTPGYGLGLLGGGYGAAQAAIMGAPFLGKGWMVVILLVGFGFAKMIATSLTIGSGGSAGDFAPSLAIGALFGGAFGHAARALLDDPRLDPGAFALVGMGAFYGGIAHVPLSALVLVCELAGTYDLLVPLMLALTVSYVACRKWTLYPAQVRSQRESPVHRDALVLDVLKAFTVEDVMVSGAGPTVFSPKTPADEMVERAAQAPGQDAFPVVDEGGVYVGLVGHAAIRRLPVARQKLVAADIMQPPAALRPADHLRHASERLLVEGLHAIPVVDAGRRIVGVINERDIARVYVDAARRAEATESSPAP